MNKSIDAVGGQAIEVAETLALFSTLEGSAQSLEALATRLEVSRRGLRPLLFLLCSIGLLEEREGKFSLSPDCQDFLSQEWPQQKTDRCRSLPWENLERAVRTGRCVVSPIEGEADGGSFFSGVVDTLFQLHSPMAQHLDKELPSTIHRVLDLGAGSAVWSLGLLSQRDHVQAVAVDSAKVLNEVTRPFVQKHGLSQRFELRPGDYHEVDLEAEHYDLVYLGHVIHSEGWDASRELLARCFRSLKEGAILAIAEWVGSEPRGLDYHANLFDLNMLMFTEHGLVFSASEMEDLVQEAGFRDLRWVRGPGRHPVLLAHKAEAKSV